jgi:hypothetical protein
MSRTTIAAVLAMLLMLAPAASARPIDSGYPAYPTPEVAPKPTVMPERITDHPFPKDDAFSALVREQESTSGSGNQGPATVSAPSPAPAPADDDAPWLIVALGIAGAALGAAALIVVLRRTRPGVAT